MLNEVDIDDILNVTDQFCTSCDKLLSIDNFYNSKRKLSGKFGECKDCVKLRTKKWLQNNKHRIRERNISRYKITLKEYDDLLKKQNFKCAICGSDKSGNNKFAKNFSIDHCHKTKKVRGLLCNSCNRGIGLFKDNIDILLKAVEYLKC